ncbi:putative ribonuclease toxin of YeeF-YezG toxin-antitoxin module [Neobacillus bataviensis]|uniref:Putative ribonuclease toxin of YeeF-YezG toxin-antitoxin module n=1 Tax=Neobacillus bataviensis TaxID=220685 RepID=A0A561CMT2_9BACI|nr:ADP-ribosyltransferase [Neobacillus bataviensis]TWD92476.1 putative ribonuclease toxin of YeeF-YezG toxin-antitoxin module [Neobacillus bataviensis]
MDVKYIPSDWEKMKDGIGDLIGLGRWGKGLIDNLIDLNDNLEDAEGDIAKYDSDGVISFHHTSQKSKYQGLFEDFEVLHSFAGKVGDIVDRAIDQPFYKDMDAFVEAMRDLTISNYTTKNRIGATETQFVYGVYGASQSLEVPKTEISIDDLFSGDNFYAGQMKLEYGAWKELNPEQDFSQEEYRQAALNTRVFQYESIRNQQENKEFWVQLGALVVIVGATLICPPAGMALGAAYGAMELSSAVSGKDWVSGRELGTGERWFRGVLAPLDIVPGVNGLTKFSSAVRLAHVGDTVGGLGKVGFHQGITHIDSMIKTAGQQSATRLKNASAAIKDTANVVKNKLAMDTIRAGRLADTVITGIKNTIPSPKRLVATATGEKVYMPVDNNHAIENSLSDIISKIDGINLGGVSKKNENSSHLKFNKDGLTPEQLKEYRLKIDKAKAQGNLKAADDARYERYCTEKVSLGEKPLDRSDWDVINERLRKNRVRGREEEIKGRKALEEHLNRPLEDNNTDMVVTYTSSEGHVTRPDSIGRNNKGEIDLVHDHKHKSGEEQVVHNDSQIRAEREMIEDKKNGYHVVTLSSDKPDLRAIPPTPRPSGPLGDKSVIYYTDPQNGKVTHKWEPNPRLPGGGRWKKL